MAAVTARMPATRKTLAQSSLIHERDAEGHRPGALEL
jgi:hypothetical protein